MVLQRMWPLRSKGAPCVAEDPRPCPGWGGLHSAEPPATPLRSPKPALAGAEARGTARTGALHTAAASLVAPWGIPGPPSHRRRAQRERMGEQLRRPRPRDGPSSRPFPKERRKRLQSLPCPRAAAPDTAGSLAQGPAAAVPPQPFTCSMSGRAAQRLLEEEAAGKAAHAAGQLWGGEAQLGSRQSAAVHAPRSRASNGKCLLSVTVNQIGEIRGLFA